jgi:hypothetical protein
VKAEQERPGMGGIRPLFPERLGSNAMWRVLQGWALRNDKSRSLRIEVEAYDVRTGNAMDGRKPKADKIDKRVGI